jgi:2-polyprenyl-3-methyl-5-hydroxy-6-metoxy-1,4-benzoquinol methylase
MTTAQEGACVVCTGRSLTTIASALGQRAYCGDCFHGWRTSALDFAYAQTAMCSLGTPRARLMTQVRFFAPYAPAGARVLEIGCATGELAQLARATLDIAHYEAIELSPAGDQARRHVDRLHVVPLVRAIESGKIEARFDLILMSHVLEHLADPGAEVAAMAEVLAPSGAMFLEVPNGSGNRRLAIDDNRAHLHFFSPASLTRLLARHRLETVATATDVRLDARYADSLQVMARAFRTPQWSSTSLSDHPALSGEAPIVVWGAGSLAEEVLANFFDVARIAFFIDRNVAKQGGLCLGRPVRGPEALGDEPRTILINSIDFADAIAEDIARIAPSHHLLVRIGDLMS